MARPISFQPTPRDAREALLARVERAPQEHAEAVLAAYDLLQELHERKILEIARTALSASDELLAKVVETADTPESIRALRNLLLLSSVLGRIEPEWLQGFVQAIPDGLATVAARREEPVTIWTILRRAMSKDSLRGLAAAVGLLEGLGRHLHADR